MRTDLFDYELPKSFIAQQPADPRDSSRLLVLERASGRIQHGRFGEIGAFLRPDDLLVANDSRVIPARLRAHKPSGGAVEIFLLRQLDETGSEWSCLVRGRGLREGARVELDSSPIYAEIMVEGPGSLRKTRFSAPIAEKLGELGELPLPPYIKDFAGDKGRYQTVYGRAEGSVAAPTAGLHFTPELLKRLRGMGVGWETITLHVGLDTFGPVTAERVADHQIHREWAEVDGGVGESAINAARVQGGRIFRSRHNVHARVGVFRYYCTGSGWVLARGRTKGGGPLRGRGRSVHLSGLSVPSGGRAAYELSSAPIIVADVGQRVRGPGPPPGAGRWSADALPNV